MRANMYEQVNPPREDQQQPHDDEQPDQQQQQHEEQDHEQQAGQQGTLDLAVSAGQAVHARADAYCNSPFVTATLPAHTAPQHADYAPTHMSKVRCMFAALICSPVLLVHMHGG
jgi:hypothetical protein